MTLILIIFLLLIPTNNYSDKKEWTIVQEIIAVTCSPTDFLKLTDTILQDDFFTQLDSMRKFQYPDNNQETCNSVDLTTDLLNKFLKDINRKTLQETREYTAFYHFNIACPNFVDSKICKDKISIQFFEKTCSFRMVIDNVYLVEQSGCIGGSQVIYGFKIGKSKIVDFGRQEAG